MTTYQQIELINGPRDGAKYTIPDHLKILHVPFSTWHPSGSRIMRGTYRPLTDDDELIGRWIWEEPTHEE